MVPQFADTVIVVLADATGALTVRVSMTPFSFVFRIPTDFGDEKLMVASFAKLALTFLIALSAGISRLEMFSPGTTIELPSKSPAISTRLSTSIIC